MNKLISIEFLKLRKQVTFKVMLLIYIVLMPLILLIVGNLADALATEVKSTGLALSLFPTWEEIFSFPRIWSYATYSAAFLNLALGIVIVVSVSNDIAYKTMRQNVIDGFSKSQLVLSKFILIVLLALFATAYTFIVSLIFGSIYSVDTSFTDGIHFIGIYFVQAVGYFTFALLLTLLLKKPVLAILLYLATMFVSWIVGWFVPDKIYDWVPLDVLSGFTPVPDFFEKFKAFAAEQEGIVIPETMSDTTRLIVGSIYIIAMIFLSYFILKRRDV